jgi:hypothetical protein
LLASGSRFSDGSDRLTTKRMARFLSVAVIVFVVVTALGPAQWQLRTRLGWEVDHVLGYFAITLLICLAWPSPLVVGSALMAFAVLLEALQSLTPDRIPNFMAALYGAGECWWRHYLLSYSYGYFHPDRFKVRTQPLVSTRLSYLSP